MKAMTAKCALAPLASIALPILVSAWVAGPVPAAAQDDRARNTAERAADHRDLRQDQRQLKDDLRDLQLLQQLIDRQQEAAAVGDLATLAEIDRRVEAMLAAEVKEAGHEARQAASEVRQDRREVRSDRREKRENRHEMKGPLEKADDRRDLRDDRRDLRDDRRDAEQEAQRREQLIRIRDEWNSLQGLTGPEPIARQGELLRELRRIAQAEIGDDAAEKKEDRRELREDRRETREDRRQR